VLISRGANMNSSQKDHWTPIHLAVYNGYLEIVKLLLERGADAHTLNGEGETPYQLSLRIGDKEIGDLLQEHTRAAQGSRISFYSNRFLTGTSILALRDITARGEASYK
jgi:ankyrin repeat protein